jgi:hypothetical protein
MALWHPKKLRCHMLKLPQSMESRQDTTAINRAGVHGGYDPNIF